MSNSMKMYHNESKSLSISSSIHMLDYTNRELWWTGRYLYDVCKRQIVINEVGPSPWQGSNVSSLQFIDREYNKIDVLLSMMGPNWHMDQINI